MEDAKCPACNAPVGYGVPSEFTKHVYCSMKCYAHDEDVSWTRDTIIGTRMFMATSMKYPSKKHKTTRRCCWLPFWRW